MECFECGKPYMAGLEFRMDGNILRCKFCHEKVIESRMQSNVNKLLRMRR